MTCCAGSRSFVGVLVVQYSVQEPVFLCISAAQKIPQRYLWHFMLLTGGWRRCSRPVLNSSSFYDCYSGWCCSVEWPCVFGLLCSSVHYLCALPYAARYNLCLNWLYCPVLLAYSCSCCCCCYEFGLIIEMIYSLSQIGCTSADSMGHRGGGTFPYFYNGLERGRTVSRKIANKKLTITKALTLVFVLPGNAVTQ